LAVVTAVKAGLAITNELLTAVDEGRGLANHGRERDGRDLLRAGQDSNNALRGAPQTNTRVCIQAKSVSLPVAGLDNP
jgi:hypothetical protein